MAVCIDLTCAGLEDGCGSFYALHANNPGNFILTGGSDQVRVRFSATYPDAAASEECHACVTMNIVAAASASVRSTAALCSKQWCRGASVAKAAY
jgi:hypothetical protein